MKKKTTGVDAQRFRNHVLKIPANIRFLYGIDTEQICKVYKHDTRGGHQRRICSRIDAAPVTEIGKRDKDVKKIRKS